MDIRSIALALLLPALAAPARAAGLAPADLPARFVATWQDHHLLGQPRHVLTREEPRHGFFPIVTEDLYNTDGILVSHVSATGPGRQTGADSYRLRLEKGRVVEIVHAPASYGGSVRGGSARPLQYDGEGRVAAMAGGGRGGLLPAGVPAAASEGPRVTVIRYESARQVHDIHVGREFAYQLVFDFDRAGRLLRSACSKGRCTQAPLIEYGEFGPVYRQEGGVETRWEYADGVVATETSSFMATGAPGDQRHYEAYRFDGCGNWIYREQYNAPAGVSTRRQTGLVRRSIDYHAPCRP